MFELLYSFKIPELLLVACTNSIVAFGNRLLNILNGMILPFTPDSILLSYFGLPLTCARF